MGILNKIREQPDNQKKIFSLISAVVITLIIVVVWFSFTDSGSDNQIGTENKLSSISPLQMIKDEFSKAFSDSSTTLPVDFTDIDLLTSTTTATSSSDMSTSTNIN